GDKSSPSPRPNDFPSPPPVCCPSRDERSAFCGPPAGTIRLQEKLALTPALSPRRGRIFGSLFRESPFGESVRRCGKRRIAAAKGSRGAPPHSSPLHRSGLGRGRIGASPSVNRTAPVFVTFLGLNDSRVSRRRR